MKQSRSKFIALVLGLFIAADAFAASVERLDIPDLPVDKAAHFGLSAVATASCIRVGQLFNSNDKITWKNRVISSLLVFGIGVGKEVSDREKKGDHALDSGDLWADGSGVIMGNLLTIDF